MKKKLSLLKLSENELKEVSGGVFPNCCCCGCQYSGSGGSSSTDNSNANYNAWLCSSLCQLPCSGCPN